MRYLKAFYLLIGVALLAAVIAEIEVAEVGVQIGRVGYGFLVILGIYFVAFSIDSVTWQMTIRGVPLNGLWAYRAWVLRMVGEAFNHVIPAASMGGEPVTDAFGPKHLISTILRTVIDPGQLRLIPNAPKQDTDLLDHPPIAGLG